MPLNPFQLELAFVAGDPITVYGDMDDDGFYYGELHGQRGLVPSNFLEEAPPSHVTTVAPPSRPSQQPSPHSHGQHQRHESDSHQHSNSHHNHHSKAPHSEHRSNKSSHNNGELPADKVSRSINIMILHDISFLYIKTYMFFTYICSPMFDTCVWQDLGYCIPCMNSFGNYGLVTHLCSLYIDIPPFPNVDLFLVNFVCVKHFFWCL